MAPLNSGMCTVWPINTTAACWNVPENTPQETIDYWTRVASEYLWAATGRRLGPSCPITVRPCRKSCDESWQYLNQGQYLGRGFQFTGGMIPYMAGGRMYNATACGCTNGCQCGNELCEVYLPGPVHDITEVTVDGVVVPSTTYTVYDAQYLTRVNDPALPDEERCWPSCQDFTLTPAQVGTFAVTYRVGIALPAMATAAVTELTAHFIRGCDGCGCGTASNQNLARLSRQGVDLEFASPVEILGDGRTGIEIVDWFINTYNPGRLTQPMRVLSPDAPKRPRLWGGVV